jgi:hypothetical protein
MLSHYLTHWRKWMLQKWFPLLNYHINGVIKVNVIEHSPSTKRPSIEHVEMDSTFANTLPCLSLLVIPKLILSVLDMPKLICQKFKSPHAPFPRGGQTGQHHAFLFQLSFYKYPLLHLYGAQFLIVLCFYWWFHYQKWLPGLVLKWELVAMHGKVVMCLTEKIWWQISFLEA